MKLPNWARAALPIVAAAALTACAGTPVAPPLPQVDSTGQPITEASDVAIAGQEAAHSIMDLPEVSGAQVPPMVRFLGVRSALATPVDTEPYTELLRDRLLLITREKLRYEEHTLPPLHGHKKAASQVPADYELTATLGADAGPDTYLLRIEFIDLHSSQPIFSGLYRIRPEATAAPAAPTEGQPGGIESTAPMPPGNNPYAPIGQGPVTPVNIH